jgi:CRP-like cAMP-binding protein
MINKRGSIFNQTEVVNKVARKMTKILGDQTDKTVTKLAKATILNYDGYDSDVEYQELVTLFKGASFGELALNDNKPRAATIRCAEPTTFAVLNKTGYDKVLK